MRRVRRLLLAAFALGAFACGSQPVTDRRLVVLAVDSLDPEITERLIREGRAPHLAALAGRAGVKRVTPIPGAEALSSWASFATGTNPGAHGVFDMIEPDRTTRRPALAPLVPRPSARWFGRWWSEGAAYAPVRGGDAFWTLLGRAGIRSAVLFVPTTFPPERIPTGLLIAGTPLPDWSGAPGSSYTWLASDAAPAEIGPTRYGGRVIALTFTRNVAEVSIAGVRAPEVIDLPLRVAHNPEARSANVQIAGQTVYLAEGQRSHWIEIGQSLGPLRRVRGLVRLHLVRAGNVVHLYVSPIQWHPEAPPSALSSPAAAAATLFARLGPYRTLAWPTAGWALADGHMADDVFLSVQDETFADRAEALLNFVDSGRWDIIVAGLEPIDTTTRLMWLAIDPGHPAFDRAVSSRFAGAIDAMYLRLDDLVGQLQSHLPDGADLVVVSTYGVYTARSVVDLNRWLAEEGELFWHTPPPPVTLAALADPALWADTVDWTRTRARAVGAGHIYVSLRGRDAEGVVEPGAEYEALIVRLTERLLALTDSLSGRRVVARVRRGTTVFTGPHAGRAPDLIVTFSPGYRVSWDSMLGGAGQRVIAPNHERWSAEHASVDEATVPGVWLSTLPVGDGALGVLDIAPTLLDYFGVAGPATAEGQSQLLEARP